MCRGCFDRSLILYQKGLKENALLCTLPPSPQNNFSFLFLLALHIKSMNRSSVLRTVLRNYHVPHDKDSIHRFSRETNLFGEVQEFLSLQEPIKRISINITNPNYVSRFCQENPALYSVDIHYKKSGQIKTLEGNHCETLVRQTLSFIRFHDETF
jgi:hypothetical protein